MTRDEAIEILYRELGTETEDKLFPEVIEARDMAIKALEERKTGRWMQVEWGKTLLGKKIVTYRCSRCAEYLDFKGLNCGRGRAWYCPNCGAKMEGAEE